ncbi:MAG TPA: hypothetical protein VNT04_07085 [Gaiellaceae bacterium]|nr:hypothetical protein [Gaiellaceae bacterium]
MVVAAVTFLAGSLAVLGIGAVRLARSRRARRDRARSAARLSFHPPKGEPSMTNLRRKLWARDEQNASLEQSQEQVSSEGSSSTGAVERVSAYAKKAQDTGTVEGSVETPAEHVADEEAKPAEAETPADLSAVGEEVGTVLESAREAAARIRSTALEEAERLRTEAQAAAAAEVQEARNLAESDRAEGSRIRADAEAHSRDTRAAADAFAEQRRREAEREAARIMEDAQTRLAGADAEVEARMRQADAKARERVELLQAEAERYEERLQSMLVVFRGMSAQLEDLLGMPRTERTDNGEASDAAIENALRPGHSGSPVA